MYYCHWLGWISERECPPSHGSRVNHRYPTWSRVDGQHTVSPLMRASAIYLFGFLTAFCLCGMQSGSSDHHSNRNTATLNDEG